MLVFFMWIVVNINGELYEAIPEVYDTLEECETARQEYIGIAESSGCDQGIVINAEGTPL